MYYAYKKIISNEQSISSPMLNASGTEFFDNYGNKVFLKGVNVDRNTKTKKNGTTSSASSPEESWFTEDDVRQIRDYGGNVFEIHDSRLGQIMPQRGVVDENYFVNWMDKWVAWGEKYKVYYIIDIGGLANFSWGPTYPTWLWEGLYPEPTNDAECDAIVRDFFDTNISKQDVNRQAFIDAWKFIANRYKNNSYAIFSIMNEPLYHIDKPNSSTARHLGDTYSTLMTQVVDGIRSTGAQQIILIDKPDVWYLSNVKPVDRNNIAWEDHLYVSSGFNISQWKSSMDTYVQKYTVDFGKPFFVGEYGVDPPLAVADWQNAISQEVAYLNTRPIAGRQWHQWGYLEGEYYDFVYNYYTPTESDWIVQTVLG
jgi:aryl-phospho-beta-D-glucosidase BglC (GH1 family)